MKTYLHHDGQALVYLDPGEAALLYSELCNTVEIDNECPGGYECADYCNSNHGTSPVLYLTPSIVALHKGLEDLFPDEEDENS